MSSEKIHQCYICLEDIKDNMYYTPCLHRFHEQCIQEWLKQKQNEETIPCPTCRSDIASLLGPRQMPPRHQDIFGNLIEIEADELAQLVSNLFHFNFTQPRALQPIRYPFVLNQQLPFTGHNLHSHNTQLHSNNSNNNFMLIDDSINFQTIADLMLNDLIEDLQMQENASNRTTTRIVFSHGNNTTLM
jgi:hypothetical protein